MLTTRPDPHRRRHAAAATATTLLLALGGTAPQAWAQPSPAGSFASGSARELEFICAGCDNPSRIAWSDQGGGWGVARAEVAALAPGRTALAASSADIAATVCGQGLGLPVGCCSPTACAAGEMKGDFIF